MQLDVLLLVSLGLCKSQLLCFPNALTVICKVSSVIRIFQGAIFNNFLFVFCIQ
jgi:hypothetical protein